MVLGITTEGLLGVGFGLTGVASVIIVLIQRYRVDDPDLRDGVTPKWAAQDVKRYDPKAVPFLRLAQVIGILGLGVFVALILAT